MSSENCAYHKVKVPKGFNYNLVEQELSRGDNVDLLYEACYVAAQLTIQEYRSMFMIPCIEGEDGVSNVEYEYQTLPFWYTLNTPNPVNWANDSVEDTIHNPNFWDSL